MEKKVALITGASRGLGRAISREFGKSGYVVAVNYLRAEKQARDVVSEIKAAGQDATFFRSDVSDSTAVKNMVDEIMNRWGKIDMCVNNAGIVADAPFAKMTEEEWDRVIAVNLKGVFNVCKSVVPHMLRKKNGHVIMIASYLGICGGYGAANYAASKGGVIGMTRSLAKEYGKKGIKVNAVCPGFMQTDMNKDLPERVIEKVIEDNALKRLNTEDEIARFIVHLSTMNNVSGQLFNLDSRIIP